MMTYGGGNTGCSNETMNLLRAGLPMTLQHYNSSTSSDTTGLADLKQSAPPTTACTPAAGMFPLTNCRMNVNSQANGNSLLQ